MSLPFLVTTTLMGTLGHEIVARLGHYALSKQRQKELDSLIPYSEIGKAANWPDTVKGSREYQWSVFLHFTGFQEPDGAHLAPPVRRDSTGAAVYFGSVPLFHPSYKLNVSNTSGGGSGGGGGATVASHSCRWIDMSQDCNNRTCLVTGLGRFIDELSNKTLLDTNRKAYLEAVKFVMHFIGDAHQLLHICNIKNGANQIKLNYGAKETDLHKFWDNDLVQKRLGQFNGSIDQYVAFLQNAMYNTSPTVKKSYFHVPNSPNEQCELRTPELTEQCMIAWISSFHCRFADQVWDLPRENEDPDLSDSYADRVVGLLDTFFVMAGFRLGYVLENSMGLLPLTLDETAAEATIGSGSKEEGAGPENMAQLMSRAMFFTVACIILVIVVLFIL